MRAADSSAAAPGLGLDRLQSHPGLAQPGQAGVTQHVTGQPGQTGTSFGAAHDLIQPGSRQRLTTARTLEDHEERVGDCSGRSFRAQVGSQGGEEPAGDRHDPLVAALAAGDEEPLVSQVHVLQPQSEHLAATQSTQQHRLDHRGIPGGA